MFVFNPNNYRIIEHYVITKKKPCKRSITISGYVVYDVVSMRKDKRYKPESKYNTSELSFKTNSILKPEPSRLKPSICNLFCLPVIRYKYNKFTFTVDNSQEIYTIQISNIENYRSKPIIAIIMISSGYYIVIQRSYTEIIFTLFQIFADTTVKKISRILLTPNENINNLAHINGTMHVPNVGLILNSIDSYYIINIHYIFRIREIRKYTTICSAFEKIKTTHVSKILLMAPSELKKNIQILDIYNATPEITHYKS